MQAAGAGKPGKQSGVQHTLPVPQQFLGMGKGEALEEILGCDGGPGEEQAVEMEPAQAEILCQGRQIGLLCVVLVQIADDEGNAFVVVHVSMMPLKERRCHPILAAIPCRSRL